MIKIKLKQYKSAKAVVAAAWRKPIKELNDSKWLYRIQCVEQILVWGFLNPKTKTIHYWSEEGTPQEWLVSFLGNNVYQLLHKVK